MILKKTYKVLWSQFALWLCFGCESKFKEVQKINFTEFVPSGDADDVNLKIQILVWSKLYWLARKC
jgi:hypothetical protein